MAAAVGPSKDPMPHRPTLASRYVISGVPASVAIKAPWPGAVNICTPASIRSALPLERLADDALLCVCGFASLRTCAFMRATCRRLRLLLPRAHVSWLDSRVFPLWEPGRARAAHRPIEYLPQHATIRRDDVGGADRIEIEVEFQALEMHTLPTLSLQLCRHHAAHAPGVDCSVIAQLCPLPLEPISPWTRAHLPCAQRLRLVLGAESELASLSRPGDFYRLHLEDVRRLSPVLHGPPTDGARPWRFVSSERVLACRAMFAKPPPLPPPSRAQELRSVRAQT